MSKLLLLADNDQSYLKTVQKILEREDYRIIPAATVAEARRILNQGSVDLAILDIRLVNDHDEKDVSGLTLAKEETGRDIPKIILTNFPSVDAVREALGPHLQGLPPAVAFVGKEESTEVLLLAIRKALQFGRQWFRNVQDSITRQLYDDYEEARKETRVHFWVALGVAIIGALLVFAGVMIAQATQQPSLGLASAASGIVIEVTNLLFFRRMDALYRRTDSFHYELLQSERFENLLASCDELSSVEKRERSIDHVIRTTTIGWLGSKHSERNGAAQSPTKKIITTKGTSE